ncbi:MAG TPA: DUF5995 family protein [Actinomycetota bacterium]
MSDRRPGQEIDELLARMDAIGAALDPGDARRHFHSVYTRTTRAVADELATRALGGFLDADWVERWDVAFAGLYLDALAAWDRRQAPGPWSVAFTAAREQPDLAPLRHVLFGINAHVNYDLPQALLRVIADEEFDDTAVVARRAKDHEHIDVVLAARVTAEDRSLEGSRTFVDRLLTPFNRAGTRRFLKEARQKVWRNASALSKARRDGEEAYRTRLRELEGLCADRVRDLTAPGQVILKLARKGFGVVLSGA